MTEQTQPTDAPLNSIELMKVVMQADEETRAFALRGTTNWAAHIGKAVQNAVLAKWGTPAGAGDLENPHAELQKAWAPGHKWEWTKPGEGRWWHHNGEPEWDPDWQYRLAATTQQPTQARAGAVQLTDEWIRSKCKEPWIFETAKQWVRMTEAAHGIKGGTQ